MYSQDTLSIQEVDQAPWLNPENEIWAHISNKDEITANRILPLRYSYPGLTGDLKSSAAFKISLIVNTAGLLRLEYLEKIDPEELLSISNPKAINHIRLKKYRTKDDSPRGEPEVPMPKRDMKRLRLRLEKGIKENIESFPRLLAGEEAGKPVVTRYVSYIQYKIEFIGE